MNWEIILYMLMSVVLPCRCTEPLHFWGIVGTAIEASQSHMLMIMEHMVAGHCFLRKFLITGWALASVMRASLRATKG